MIIERHEAEPRSIGTALREMRVRSGKTLGDLARFLDVPVSVASSLEHGRLDHVLDHLREEAAR